METETAQENQGILLKGPSKIFSNVFLWIALALVSGFVIGFIMRSIKPFNNFFATTPRIVTPSTVPPQAIITEQELPFGLAVLKNPLVYQWRGSVEGTLIDKTATSITLSKDGYTITIPVDQTIPFFDPRQKDRITGRLQLVSLNDIPIGIYLRGEFFTTPTSKNKNSIVGISFEVVAEKSK